MNRQRKVIYAERQKVLEGADLHDQVNTFITDVVEGYVKGATADGFAEEWDLDKLWNAFRQLYPISIKIDDLAEEAGGRDAIDAGLLEERIKADILAAYRKREEEFGAEVLRDAERRVILDVLDRKWREHLYEMDYLQEGIALRAYAQRDPLIEYQREGYDMFTAMLEGIKENSVNFLFRYQPPQPVEESPISYEAGAEPNSAVAEAGSIIANALRRPPREMIYTAPGEDGEVEVRRSSPEQRANYGNVERNAPCPCGSGKKFKRCHGDPKHATA